MKYKMLLGKILFYIFIIYVGVSTVVYFYQRKLLYHPGENNYLDEGPLNHKIEKVYIQSDNKLVAWRYVKDKSFKTILFFHGNAGKLDNRIYKLNEFSKLDVNYLIFAYRGFSGNEGKPTEKGLYNDAEAAKNWLNSKNIKDSSIVLYGCLLYTSPSPRDKRQSRMPSSA